MLFVNWACLLYNHCKSFKAPLQKLKISGETHHVKESHYKYNTFKYFTDGLKIETSWSIR